MHKELDKIGVHADLGQIADHIDHMIIAHRALNAYAAMAVCGRFAQVRGNIFQGNAGNALAILAGADKCTAAFPEQTVCRQQHAAGIAAGDNAGAALHL